jgi:DNA helicase II / ATP-dependent DNA helicase PcrA
MRERVGELLGLYPLPAFVGTFHRWALVAAAPLRRPRVGLRRDFAILDTDDQLGLVKEALELEGLSDKAFAPRTVLSAISGAKNRLLDPAPEFDRRALLRSARWPASTAATRGCWQALVGVDFDDMISLAVRAARRATRRSASGCGGGALAAGRRVPGHQPRAARADPPPRRRRRQPDRGRRRGPGDLPLARRRARQHPALRGQLPRRHHAQARAQLPLDAEHPRRLGRLVAHNEGRRGKTLWTERGGGDAARALPRHRRGRRGALDRRLAHPSCAATLPLSQIAILVRTNAQTRSLEEELLRREVPYVLVGGTRFYERAEIKDLVAYLRVLRNPRDSCRCRASSTSRRAASARPPRRRSSRRRRGAASRCGT